MREKLNASRLRIWLRNIGNSLIKRNYSRSVNIKPEDAPEPRPYLPPILSLSLIIVKAREMGRFKFMCTNNTCTLKSRNVLG